MVGYLGYLFGEHLSVKSNEVENNIRGSDGPEVTRDETYEILPSPDKWETYSYFQIREHFSCSEHSRDQSKPLHILESWNLFREKYNEVVDDSFKFDDPVPPTQGYSIDIVNHAPPPFVAKFSPGMGRGVFATRDISEGELVHNGNHSAMKFADAMAWRRFVFSLPKKMACDIVEWSWTQKLSDDGRLQTFVDLNISAFFNTGWSRKSNVGPKESTSMKFYAAGDIKKGTELLYNYNMYETNWDKVGL